MDAIEDVDIATVAPLRVLPADVGAKNAPGAVDPGALAPADEEMEGVAYEVIESDNDDDDLTCQSFDIMKAMMIIVMTMMTTTMRPRLQRHQATILDDSNHQLSNCMPILMG